ncbi:MAG: segregation/condensation protein A [Candidatus Caldatribacteriota bacterium]|nr:segregation/condensation protein A [Atribacterota bacterium]MDD3030794.1 segregation/condensation protein A [Atribacterota bacterium]MDD3640180.1 segregation/condensation protein A [Atribacterota bacterium]MDD4288280.1 segregation/condensation protein A [Atribacterota bacterium]MDD4764646.1 segregation/condensation protein A [Atribacterota bacterium]
MKKNEVNNVKIEQYGISVEQLFYKAKNNEIDPNEISLLEIIEEYLKYIILTPAKGINIDIVADFLVSISNLILWKSNLLLPVNNDMEDTENDIENSISNEELWVEYQKYHSLVKILEDRENKQKDIYLTYLDPKIEQEERFKQNEYSDLILAIEAVLSRKKEYKTINIKKREYNIVQKIAEIENSFKHNNGKLSFYKLIANNYTKIEIIVTFLALLELICQGKVYYRQSINFGDIIFYRKDDRKLAKKKINHKIIGKE